MVTLAREVLMLRLARERVTLHLVSISGYGRSTGFSMVSVPRTRLLRATRLPFSAPRARMPKAYTCRFACRREPCILCRRRQPVLCIAAAMPSMVANSMRRSGSRSSSGAARKRRSSSIWRRFKTSV